MSDEENGSNPGNEVCSDDVDNLSASSDSEPEEQPNNAPYDPELDGDDDSDGGGEVAALAAPQKTQSPFSLKGGSVSFSSRSQNIFDCLDSVAKLSSPPSKEKVEDAIFVRPLPPGPSLKTSHPPPRNAVPAKKRGVPDYLVHPERWTRYSLEDVPETSDKGNSRVASQFLASLLQRKEEPKLESPGNSPCSSQQKILFSRPRNPAMEQSADELSAGKSKEKEMHLSHLEEEEDEDAEGREKGKAAGKKAEVGKTGERKPAVKGVEAGDSQMDAEEKGQKQEQKGSRGVEGLKRKEQANLSFHSFKKVNKNYRKSSQQEDN